MQNCSQVMRLPVQLVHFVRDPYELVLSAYFYHRDDGLESRPDPAHSVHSPTPCTCPSWVHC